MSNSSAAVSQPKKSNRAIRVSGITILFLIALSSVYAWTSLQRSCDATAVEEASARLIRQRNSYDHTYQFATSVSQNAVVRPVADLQQILMDTQQVPVPVCMRTAKNDLIDYMGTVVHAFQAYGAQEPDANVRDLIRQSQTYYDNFARELEAVRRCAPFCIP